MKELFKLPLAEIVEFNESFITLSNVGGGGDSNTGGMGGEDWG